MLRSSQSERSSTVASANCSTVSIPCSASVALSAAEMPSIDESLTIGRGDDLLHLRSDLALHLLFAADVDVPADQLRRQSHVLSALADGQALLFVLDGDLQLLDRRNR